MEKTYEAVLEIIKQSYLSACWSSAFADATDYNGDSYYECEHVNYAAGSLSSLQSLVDQLGITISPEEIEKEKLSAEQQYKEETGED